MDARPTGTSYKEISSSLGDSLTTEFYAWFYITLLVVAYCTRISHEAHRQQAMYWKVASGNTL